MAKSTDLSYKKTLNITANDSNFNDYEKSNLNGTNDEVEISQKASSK